MGRLFFGSLKRHILSNKAVSAMLFLGVFVAVLCISIILGYAMKQYFYSTSSPEYSTVTVEPGAELLADVRSFPQEMDTLFGSAISNVLYLVRESPSSVLIGWQGSEPDRWFPMVSGRFFNEQEQREGAKAAYISYEYIGKIPEKEIELFSDTYEIIGTGWIATFNIRSGISDQAQAVLFPERDLSPEEQANVEETLFTILPYKTFLSNVSPALILVHFDHASRSDLLRYSEILRARYPDSRISFVSKDSASSYNFNNQNAMIGALFLGVVACITIVQIMEQWLAFYRKEMMVYRICRMRKFTCVLLLWGHWAMVFIAGSIAAVLAHILCFPILEVIDADAAPAIGPLLIVLLLVYLATILLTGKKVSNILQIQDKGGLQ